MAKTRDVAQPMREFNKIFEQFTMRHDWVRSYAEFIQWACTAFAFRVEGINHEFLDRRHEDAVRRYSESERALMLPMLHELTKEVQSRSDMNGWGDPLGEFYEIISSSHKSSWLGQFFTPESLCDMIAKMQPKEIDRPIVNDPACGSGRLLLALHATDTANRGYNVGCDIDGICVDMAALNMMMHGMEGEVIEMDTLRMEFRRGWRVNPWLYSLQFPCLVPILRKEHSLMFDGEPVMFAHWRDKVEEQRARPREPTVIAKPEPKLTIPYKPTTGSQLTLF